MERKTGFTFTFGLILIAVSLFMLFKNADVVSIRFFTLGRLNTGAILIILLILTIVFAVARPSLLSKALVGAVLAGLVLSLLLGLHIVFRRMSVLDVILIVLPLAVGLGLVLRGLFTKD